MTASPASSHTQDEQRAQKHKSTPRQQLARANQKSNHNVLKGLPHDIYYRVTSDAETNGEKHKQKNADNIEILQRTTILPAVTFIVFLVYGLKKLPIISYHISIL